MTINDLKKFNRLLDDYTNIVVSNHDLYYDCPSLEGWDKQLAKKEKLIKFVESLENKNDK